MVLRTRRRVLTAACAAALAWLPVIPAQAAAAGHHPARSDGWIAFVSDRDSINAGTKDEITNDDIYLLEPRSGRTVRITRDPATDQYPRISRDGRTLVFQSDRSTKDFPNPDHQFAFFSCRLKIKAGTPQCRHVRRVASSVPPIPGQFFGYYALTPDGRNLVYTNGDLFIAPLNGRRAPVRLVQRAAGVPPIVQPDVSPDGQKVAYNNFGNIWQVGIDGSNPTQLTNRGPVDDPFPWVNSGPDYSPDGSEIAFHANRLLRNEFDVWVMKAEPEGPANRAVDLTAGVSGPGGLRPSQERFPSWSPDGRRIAFHWHYEFPTIGPGYNEGEIYVVRNNGTRVRNLTHNYRLDLNEKPDLNAQDDRQIGDIQPDWGRLHR